MKKKEKKGIWLSNTAKKDVAKIKKAFPDVVENSPRAMGGLSSKELAERGVVGLYAKKEEKE